MTTRIDGLVKQYSRLWQQQVELNSNSDNVDDDQPENSVEIQPIPIIQPIPSIRPSALKPSKKANVYEKIVKITEQKLHEQPETVPKYVEPAHPNASSYYISENSVVYKETPCNILFCYGKDNTWAHWIWCLNLVCFIAHTGMILVTLWMAYWRHGRNAFHDTDHVMIPIYRIRNIPTTYMLENNISKWSAGWNLTSTETNSGLFLQSNGMPINFATLIIAFFATSAIFHLWALVVGAFDRFWYIYWRQLDNARAYWRWIEYSISASIMASLSLRF